jgi:hypothetical protein
VAALHAAAALAAWLAMGQAPRPPAAPPATPPAEPEAEAPPALPAAAQLEVEQQARARLAPTFQGLEFALRTEFRFNSVYQLDVPTVHVSQLQLNPSLSYTYRVASWGFAAGYTPQMIFARPTVASNPFVKHAGYATALVRATPLWTLDFALRGQFGDEVYLGSAPTAPGSLPGALPPGPQPVPGISAILFERLEASVSALGRLSRDATLRLAARGGNEGGVGDAYAAIYPPQRGVRLDGSLELVTSSFDAFTTSLAAQARQFTLTTQSNTTALFTGSEVWRRRIGRATYASAGAGVGYANTEVETKLSLGRFMPLLELRLQHDVPLGPVTETASQGPIRLIVQLTAEPYVDPLRLVAYERWVAAGIATWVPTPAWRLEGTLSVALVPYSNRLAEEYGAATIDLGYLPTSFVRASVGVLWQLQSGLRGPSFSFYNFATYFAVTLQDRERT